MPTYVSDAWGDTLTGTAADDRFVIGRGPDVVTGGGGSDVFAWTGLPASAGRITDYDPANDRLDFTNFYAGDAVADGRLTFHADGQGNTRVMFDRDGAGGDWPFHMTTIIGVTPEAMYAQFAGDSKPVLPTASVLVSADESRMPGGSNTTGATTFSSWLMLESEDGFGDITLGGQVVVRGGVLQANSQTVLGGELKVTGFDSATGRLDLTFTRAGPYDHAEPHNSAIYEGLTLAVSDRDGDVTSGTFYVGVGDDRPHLVEDSATIMREAGAPVTGNVLANDKLGADGGQLVSIRSAAPQNNLDSSFDSSGQLTVQGLYGALTIKADGSYSYAANAQAPHGAQDYFRYTVRDGDGDEVTEDLLIHVNATLPPIKAGLSIQPGSASDDIGLDEKHLPGGSAPNSSLTADLGAFIIKASDGVDDLVVGGQKVISDGVFTPVTFTNSRGDEVSFTGYDAATGRVSYTYTLKVPELEPPEFSGADYRMGIELTDQTGARVLSSVTIHIRDDRPTPAADLDTAAPGGTATGNVLTDASPGDAGDADSGADTPSADGFRVTEVAALSATGAWDPSRPTSDWKADAQGNFTVESPYGVLTLNVDGSYTYQAKPGAPAGVEDRFRYTLGDGDNFNHATTLTITITGGGQTGPSEIGFASSGTAPSGQEGTGAEGVVTYEVFRSGDTSAAASATWTVESWGNVPVSAADFPGGVYPAGTVTFQPGQSSATFQVRVAGDAADENHETFLVRLGNVQGGSPGQLTQVGTILDDDEPPPAGGEGRVINSTGPGSTMTGGAGNDTLNAGAGGDIMTGGGGADLFVYADVPWKYGEITDMALGTDRIDLSGLLSDIGYTGSDPVADGYVKLINGHAPNSTYLYIDRDGPGSADQWGTYVAQLTGVHGAPGPAGGKSTLTWADISGGGGSGEPPPPPPPPPSGGDGEVINSAGPGSNLVGGSGDDTLNASRGPDTLTGNGGADRFVFADENWAPATITDFVSGHDKIDLRGVFDDWGYAGTDPFADGRVILLADSAGTKVLLDDDGPGGDWGNYVLLIQGVQPGQIAASDWMFQ